MQDNPIAVANGSGFPLQTAVEAVARQREREHGWYFLSREHSWRLSDGGPAGFIDLVLGGQRYNPRRETYRIRGVIECKRADGAFVFLLPQAELSSGAPAFRAYSVVSGAPQPSGWRAEYLLRRMPSAEFCASSVRKGARSDAPDARGLEAWCRELLTGVTALAEQEAPALSAQSEELRGAVFIPMLVTTARLYTLRYDPTLVNLEDGFVPAHPQSAHEPAPWVHFQKDFGLEPFGAEPLNPDKDSTRPRQSVLVVRASEFERFLLEAFV